MRAMTLLRPLSLALAFSLGSAVTAYADTPVPLQGMESRTNQQAETTPPVQRVARDVNTTLWTSDTANPWAENQATSMSSDSGLRCNPGPGFDRCEAQTAPQAPLD